MRVTVSFSTFDPLFSDAPCLCDVCESKPSVFQFESHSDNDSSKNRPVNGYCCAACAIELLEKLRREESLSWEQEEVSVRGQGVDVSDFHQRRLATFGAHGRN